MGAAAKPAKQEKVKMGFQLYRPPTILAQASSEVRKAGVHSACGCMLDHACTRTIT